MNLIVLCGPPGAGKSTLAKQLAEKEAAVLHCFDDYPGALSPFRTQEALDTMLTNIGLDIVTKNVVVDNLNVKIKSRQEILEAIGSTKCKKVLVVIRPPLKVCMSRNNKRSRKIPERILELIYNDYQEPTLEEGWDEIIYCKDDDYV